MSIQTMIYVKETQLDQKVVRIQVDGILDDADVPLIKKICQEHLEAERKVLLNLGNLVYISRAGRAFLENIQRRVTLENSPLFYQ